ncbi:hypothetical protein PLEOSDRAFT_1088320 [Pleurotus ostreatus PC15]|uniref:F-box domain-containing protein n=1 Tax=Pleurotus ostreatus (strain PC15) TaxID=1137138 RepID=A0A067P1K4_PLEO1|nr:hypothetical protein PLEOSDRAFT_1088320 [Pleurotus ostreatus PC15]
MSLRQDVLRSQSIDSYVVLDNNPDNNQPEHDSDDESYVNVISLPGTPARTRPSSPTGRSSASSRPAPGPLHLRSKSAVTTDPLRALPTEISQKVFGRLSITELARCARVSKKWNRSQSINYVWFQHYRKENFHDESLPPGKWTKRESKQNWRIVYIQSQASKEPSMNATTKAMRGSGYTSPSGTASGYQTPREIREEKWKLEAEASVKPGKVEMREMYRDLGGRKSKTKFKMAAGGIRDKGGWDNGGDDGY